MNSARYPNHLYHRTPPWVEAGAIFHIRIRCSPDNPLPLTDSRIAKPMLESARHYTAQQRWYHYLFLLMPDHVHALLAFPQGASMSSTVGAWKKYHRRRYGVLWQDNYFDHRVRNEAELVEKSAYIRRNPVAKQLCQNEMDWSWVIDSDYTPEGGRRRV